MAPNAQRKARDSLRLIENKYKSSYDRQVPLKDDQFRRILQETPPLFRHHFWLKHKLPALWFDMRLNYSRSVATTSIIGHVVGLGDRHVSNILMDEARGELVHIDLGIAFDQVRPRWKLHIRSGALVTDCSLGYGLAGQTPTYPGARPVPPDSEYHRRFRDGWRRRSLPEVLRRDAARPP